MKLSVLPKFNMQPDEKELAYVHKPLYEGKNRFLSYILNRSFYLLAFLIPFLTLLLFMKYFGYAPFGEKNMFVIDGAYINLPVLTGMIHDIREGTFHLYTLKGTTGSEFFSSIAYYLASPATLFCLFFSQKTAVIILSFLSVLRIALSGPVFLYYLTHRLIGKKGSPYDPMMLVFSLGYSLSAFALVQYNDFMYLDHFMLFPLLVLFLEQLMQNGTWKKFLFLNAFLLFSNFYLGIILDIFLILYYFLKNQNDITTVIYRFFKLIGAYFASFMLSAVTVIPGMCAFIEKCYVNYMDLYQANIHKDYFAFFLRHLFFNSPSFSEIGNLGSNLYFGIFLLFLAFLYFISNHYSLKERLMNGLFLFILVLSLCSMQSSHFFHLMSIDTSSYTCYSFVYLFFLLSIGHDILSNIRTTPVWQILVAVCVPIVLAIVCMNFTTAKPNYDSIYYSLALLLVYGIIVLLYRIGSIKRDSFYSLILCIFCLEILANAFQLSFQVAKISTPVEESLILNGPTYRCDDEFSRSVLYDQAEYSYHENLNSQFSFNRLLPDGNLSAATLPMEAAMSGMRYLYLDEKKSPNDPSAELYKTHSTSDEYKIYENTSAFPSAYAVPGNLDNAASDPSTYLTKYNSIAKNLGSNADVYIESMPSSIELSLPEDSDITIDYLGNNIFSLGNQPDITQDTSIPLTLKFTPEKDGELYILLHGTPYYYGVVSKGETCEYTFNATSSTFYDNIFWVQFFYTDTSAINSLAKKLSGSACPIRYDGATSFSIDVDTKQPSTIVTALPYDVNFRAQATDAQNLTVFNYHNQLAIYAEAGTYRISLSYCYAPFYIGLFSTLFFIVAYVILSHRKVFSYAMMHGTALKSAQNSFTKGINGFYAYCKENYVYFAAFFLPMLSYLLVNMALYLEPFGPYSRFDSDGCAIQLPAYYAISSLLKNGITAHSWYGMGGYNTSAVLQMTPFELLYAFIPDSAITLFSSMFPMVAIALSGVSIVFYFTHRLFGKKAHKKDYRLLIPVICYTMCNYMVLSYNNTSWTFALAMLPLIILGMDYLMIKNKSRYYIAALGLSLVLQYYITMFICFYLIVRFFTYRFDSIMNFIKNGLRFALASLFTGCLSFYTLYFALYGLSGSTYGSADSAFPLHYFFNGFEFIFNRMSIFAEGFTISWNDGNVNLYHGILPIILLVVYLFTKKIHWKEKLSLIIPYFIFFISLNESVLNYIFNGFHYQHGVPNRFAFLVVLFAAFMSYDCIRIFSKLSKKIVLAASACITAVFVISYFVTADSQRNTLAFICTLILILIYTLILCKPWKKKISHKHWQGILIGLLFLEMFVNSYYQCSKHYSGTYYVTYLSSAIESAKKELKINDTLDHVNILSPLNDNQGNVYQIKINTIFSPSITSFQVNYGEYLGCYATHNAVVSLNSQTPLGYALGNTRYLFLDGTAYSSNIKDVKRLTPIALYDSTIVYENKNCFPFAYYLPASTKPFINVLIPKTDLWNSLTSILCDTEQEIISHSILKNGSLAADGTPLDSLPFAETENHFTLSICETDNKKFNYNINATAPKTGSVYTKLDDFQYIGDYKAGEKIEHTVDGRSIYYSDMTSSADLYTINNDLVTELCERVNEHPFRVESFTDDTLSGSIDMPEDGYINFTMPYDERWHILLDGEEVKADSLGNGFLTLAATKGHHEVSMEYIDNRRTPAVLVTVFFWLLFFGACYISDKRRHRLSKQEQ